MVVEEAGQVRGKGQAKCVGEEEEGNLAIGGWVSTESGGNAYNEVGGRGRGHHPSSSSEMETMQESCMCTGMQGSCVSYHGSSPIYLGFHVYLNVEIAQFFMTPNISQVCPS